MSLTSGSCNKRGESKNLLVIRCKLHTLPLLYIIFSLFFLFLCRSLGVHCSKVRSLTLDSWEPELLKVHLSDTFAHSFFCLCCDIFPMTVAYIIPLSALLKGFEPFPFLSLSLLFSSFFLLSHVADV